MTHEGAAAPASRQRGRIFYGWYIVAGGFLLSAMLGGLMFHAFGQYVVVLGEEFGWSRTSLSIAFSIQMVESGLLGPAQGWALDRFGPRRIMLIGITIFGLGFMLLSQINTLTEFYIAFVVIALGLSAGAGMGVAVAIVNWFRRRRALAVSIATAGFAVGGLLQPGVAWSLEHVGWRETAIASGLIVLALGLPLASLMRHRPGPYGYGVDGDPLRWSEAGSDAGPGLESDEVDFTWQEALRTRAFWLISLGHATSLLVLGAVMVHFVSHVTDSLGYSLSQAANLLLVITVTSVIGMLVGGYVGDRFSMRHILALAMLGHMTSLLALALWVSPWGAVAFTLIHGIAFGVRGPLTQAIRADYFGRASFGRVMGFSSLIILIGMVLGPIVAGLSYDLTGSYQTGFVSLAIVAGLGSFAFLAARRPAPPPSHRAARLPRAAGGGSTASDPVPALRR